MKKLFLIVVFALLSLQSFTQVVGVITIEKDAIEVPVGHWYVSKDKKLDDHVFFYDEESTVKELLQNILLSQDQDIDFPKDKDEAGDSYWLVTWESGFTSTLYITTVKGFSLLTVVTE